MKVSQGPSNWVNWALAAEVGDGMGWPQKQGVGGGQGEMDSLSEYVNDYMWRVAVSCEIGKVWE